MPSSNGNGNSDVSVHVPSEHSPLILKPSDTLESRGESDSGSGSALNYQRQQQQQEGVDGNEDDGMDQSSKSTLHLILLTLSVGGLQVVWSVELSNGSPYLLSLGMSKALVAFVWVAGPLTGAIVQPYIGIRSDNCHISWGRRKPFMLFGGLATIASLLLLAWVREITVALLSGVFGLDEKSQGVHVTTLVLATGFMYCLDFAINTVQAGIRAFIVDGAPAHQQEAANAWASRWTGIGNILGYVLGYMDLPKRFPSLGNTQFKVLCVIATSSLATTLLISCLYIKERDPRLNLHSSSSNNPGLIAFFKQAFRSARRLPRQIRKVCIVQLASWVGWFPFLFYSTTYIGQLYVNPIFAEHPNMSETEIDRVWVEATRIGTFALLVNAVITLASNIILPILIVPTYKQVLPERTGEPSSSRRDDTTDPLLRREVLHEHIGTTVAIDEEKSSIMTKLRIPGLTLRRTWLLSHLLFALCMMCTFFINSTQVATAVLGLVGVPWAVTLWAPFALISAEVAQSVAAQRMSRFDSPEVHHDDDDEDDDAEEEEVDIESAPKATDNPATGEAGIVLGLHNVAISIPQIFSTLVSSLIFKSLQKPRGEPWDDSVGWVMRFGGAAALVAAVLTTTLEEKGSS